MCFTNGTNWTNYTVETDPRSSDPDVDNLIVRSLTATASTLAPGEPLDDQVGDLCLPPAEAAEQDDLPLAQLIDMPIDWDRVFDTPAVDPALTAGLPNEWRRLTAFLMDETVTGGAP
jgi:hypothetical protein